MKTSLSRCVVAISIGALCVGVTACKKSETTPQGGNAPEVAAPAETKPLFSDEDLKPTEGYVPKESFTKDGWSKLTMADDKEVWRCFDYRGCPDGDKIYKPGVDRRDGGFFCRNNVVSVQFEKGYICSQKFAWPFCVEGETCTCGLGTIGPETQERFCVNQQEMLDLGEMEAFYEVAGGTPESSPLPADWSDECGYSCVLDKYAEKHAESGDADEDEMDSEEMRICGVFGSPYAIVDKTQEFVNFACAIDEFSIEGSEEGVFYCDEPDGCRTLDGRIYHIFSQFRNGTDETKERCHYHLVGTEDTTEYTHCVTGDCVYPEDADPDLMRTTLMAYKHIHEDNLPEGFTKWALEPQKQRGAEDELEGDEEEELSSFFAVEGMIVENQRCKGGKRYCHGKGNAPMLAPAKSDGYECLDAGYVVNADPKAEEKTYKAWTCTNAKGCACGEGVCSKGATCQNEQCYCGKDVIAPGSGYTCVAATENSPAFAMCVKDACLCGEGGSVKKNESCHAGRRACGSALLPADEGWACDAPKDAERPAWRCEAEGGCHGCTVDGCPQHALCVDGQCECGGQRPGLDFTCGRNGAGRPAWICNAQHCSCYGSGTLSHGDACTAPVCVENAVLTPQGCQCGKTASLMGYTCEQSAIHSDFVNVCNQKTGCACGKNHCAYGMYCVNDVCETPDGADAPAAKTYWLEKGWQDFKASVRCEDDKCPCGTQTCQGGQSCMQGRCEWAPLSILRYGTMFRYEFSEEFSEDARTNEALSKGFIERMFFGDWMNCASGLEDEDSPKHAKPWTLTSGDGDKIDGLFCSFSTDCDAMTEDGDYPMIPYGWLCMDDEGCMCGSYLCPESFGCVCNTTGGKLDCTCHSDKAIKMAPDGSRLCGVSHIRKEDVDLYRCMEDYGYVCTREYGCTCGDAKCANGAVCIQPGQCSAIAVPKK